MSITLMRCAGVTVLLPDRSLSLIDRGDGGNLIVNPPRAVWDRSELNASELVQWSFLVATAGRAMIDVLPQLDGGCINYWDAGNWALNDHAPPQGRKTAPEFRRVHLHLLGRSRTAKSPSNLWGEAPKFPDYDDRHAWAAGHERLTPAECHAIVSRAVDILRTKYGVAVEDIDAGTACHGCRYPTAGSCEECDPA
ncbi:MAG: hypothetical protein ACXVJT_13475 [Thermoanaerobaculia bacterium]